MATGDPHAPAAAAAAETSLKEAFPPKKDIKNKDNRDKQDLNEADDRVSAAVRFCRAEVAAAVAEVLLEQTKESLSDPKWVIFNP